MLKCSVSSLKEVKNLANKCDLDPAVFKLVFFLYPLVKPPSRVKKEFLKSCLYSARYKGSLLTCNLGVKVRSLSFDIFQKYGTSTPNPIFELLAKLGTKKPDLYLHLDQGEKVLENKILENHKF